MITTVFPDSMLLPKLSDSNCNKTYDYVVMVIIKKIITAYETVLYYS